VIRGDRCFRLSHDKSSGDVKLTIEKSVISDSGVYAVHAGSGSGRATSEIRVDVISVLPVFVHGLTDQTVTVGEPATFTAVVRGTPRPQIHWSIGGVDAVNTGDKYIVTDAEDGRVELRIVAVSAADVGLWCECKASSEAGKAVSRASLMPGWCQRKADVPECSARTLRVVG